MEQFEIDQLLKEIEKELQGKTVRYLYKDDLHHLIVEGGGLSFFIYIHHKFFEEEDAMDILNELNKYQVIETINNSREPLWLYLSATGLQNVDASFIRTKPK